MKKTYVLIYKDKIVWQCEAYDHHDAWDMLQDAGYRGEILQGTTFCAKEEMESI